jgi:hypothetical protein
LAFARSRAKEQSLANVTFLESELSTIAVGQPFDAAIGCYVLCFQPSRRVAAEDFTLGPSRWNRPIPRARPEASAFISADPNRSTIPFRRTGMDVRTGIKLYSTFLAAGLAGPTMRLHAVIGGAKGLEEAHVEAHAAIALAAAIERTGVATPSSARGPGKRRSTPRARATLVNSRLPGQS